MLNSFRLKLVTFTKKNEQNKNKKSLQAHMSLLKQDRRNNNKNSKQKLCKHHRSIVSSLIEDGKFKSKESQSYIIINTIAKSQFHTEIKTK